MRKWMNRAAAGLLAATVLSGTIFAAFGMTVSAEKSEYDDDDFTVEAELSVSAARESFDVLIEVTNDGPDFEGTVRVIAENGGSDTCAYDTMISLSEGATKQFVVSIPISSMDTYYSGYGQTGTLYVSLLDHKDITVMTEKLPRFFQDYQEKVTVGILSDAYSELDYLETGYSIYIINNNYPVERVELSKDTLADGLDSLDYLVIDQYDTSALSGDAVAAVEDWTNNGGMLIFGTGMYAYDVLGGFDPSFLQTECLGIYDESKMDFITENGIEDMYSVTGAYSSYDYYGVSIDMYIPDIYETDTAFLSGFSMYDGNYHYGGGYGSSVSCGSGSITYLYYALSDPYVAAASSKTSYVVENILEMAAEQTTLDYATFHNDEDGGIRYTYNIRSALGIIDMEKSDINYNILKALIVVYVILVGPLVYLVLSRLKKRELYWVAVPALALLFVGIVSFAGSGFKIADTTVCSVTFVNAGGAGETGSVLFAYSAGHDDWQISLAGESAYAGPLQNDHGWANDPMDYYFHVVEDMSGTSVGIRPRTSFETTMFQRRAEEPTEGELLAENIEVTGGGVKGYVTNETGYDLSYLLIYDNSDFAIVEGVRDGDEINLRKAVVLKQASASSIDDVLWRTAEQEYEENKSLAAQMAALYIGLLQAVDFQGTVVVGVTPDYSRVTEGNYKENSYGVFYCVQG